MANSPNTAEKIMDVAQRLVQTRGYHAFSYRDISEEVGIKTASIHYYYPAKSDLAKALLSRIRDAFESALHAIDAEGGNATEKLEKFVGIFFETYGQDGRLCPFCMIATSQETVPESVQAEVRGFWSRGEDWLEAVLRQGLSDGQLAFAGDARVIARTLVSSLEGTMVVARAYQDRSRLEETAEFLLSTVKKSNLTH